MILMKTFINFSDINDWNRIFQFDLAVLDFENFQIE